MDSINFSKVYKWHIVYDTTKIPKQQIWRIPYDSIEQHAVDGSFKKSCAGHEQRNFGMSLVKKGYVYFLDDDNIIHPNFFTEINFKDPGKIFTFDQQVCYSNNDTNIRLGNRLSACHIDMAQYCFDVGVNSTKLQFESSKYIADGIFIEKLYAAQKQSHVYIPKVCSYYNYLRSKK